MYESNANIVHQIKYLNFTDQNDRNCSQVDISVN